MSIACTEDILCLRQLAVEILLVEKLVIVILYL